MSDSPAGPPPRLPGAEPASELPSDPPLIPFDPVPVRPRRDGWTADRQRAFIRVLAETGIVRRAAAAAGMSEESAHRLARRADAQAFCGAWDAALRMAARPAAAKLYEYALDGMTETVWRDGEIVYRRRRPSEKALIFLLSRLDPVRYGRPPAATAWTDREGELIDMIADTADFFEDHLAGLRDLPPEDDDAAPPPPAPDRG